MSRESGVDGELMLFNEELGELRATDLKNALRVDANAYAMATSPARVWAVPEGYEEEGAPTEDVGFEWDGRALVVTVSYEAAWPDDGEQTTAVNAVTSLVGPFLSSARCTLIDVVDDPWRTSSTQLGIEITFDPPTRGVTVKELYDIGVGTLRLCKAFGEGSVTRETVAHLVRGGGAHLLVGQPEGNWLDAKSQEYDLTSFAGKVSLAQAVARFCNAEEGGLIVIGAHAKKIPGGEVITKLPGVKPAPGAAARYSRVLNIHLYPLPERLNIDEVAAADGRSLILIDVPPQPEELKPFLVHGAIRVDGETEGAFISIVRRRGEESVPITASMIHATLAAGRSHLRRGEPVSDPRREQFDAARNLRNQVLTDHTEFNNRFWPDARGRTLERSLQTLAELVTPRHDAVVQKIHDVRSTAVRNAADEFYRSWETVVAGYDQAADKELEQKRTGRTFDGPDTADLIKAVLNRLEEFTASVDRYMDSIDTR